VTPVAWPQVACNLCSSYAKPVASGLVLGDLSELSGIAASRAQKGVFFAHNDSGDAPRVFVLDGAGKGLGTLCLAKATNVDWEDIAVGPCPMGSCIFVGDIGDNNLDRPSYGIYRVIEPSITSSLEGTVAFDYFPFVYDDGPHNAEALVVDPVTGRAYVVLKAEGSAPVFEVALTSVAAGQSPPMVHAVRVGEVSIKSTERVTAADLSPCGNALLVRTTGGLYERRSPDGAPASIDALLLGASNGVPVADEVQGEAVSYLADGRGYVTSTESAGRGPVPLQLVACK